MKSPDTPANDAQRVAALLRYDVLDTFPERAMDDLTVVAAQICGTPTSLISLVDDHRQWFKSRVGFRIPETPREVSFCGYAILGTTTFVVNDTALDERFADNPLVVDEPHIRFYAGAPLVTPDGYVLGTLCVMDHVPRHLDALQLEALEALSRQVVGQLELRRRTRELAASEDRLLQVFRSCPVAVLLHRMSDRTFVDVNEAFTAMLGWPRHEVVGRSTADLGMVEPATSAQLREHLDVVRALRDVELAVRTRTGESRHVLMACEIITLHDEPHTVTTFVDITARREAYTTARRLAAIVASSDDAIIGKNLEGTVTSWNAGAEAIFGYTADEMIGSPIARLIPPDRMDEETRILARLARGEVVEQFETRRLRKNGEFIEVSMTASPIRDAEGRVVGASKLARDIGERRRAELARAATEKRYRTLFEHAPNGILIADRESRYLDANESICRMLGYTREELLRMTAAEIVAPAEIPFIEPALHSILGTNDYRREWQFRRKDGTTFPGEVVATTMPDGTLVAMVQDVSERKHHEARLRRLVDSNAQGVMFWGIDGQITMANDAFLDIIGYTRDDLLASQIDWPGLTPDIYAEADRRSSTQIAETGVCVPYEKEFFRKDGSRVPVLVGAASFPDSPAEGVCFVLDLTERKKLEQQFLRAQRMESIGTLAGGIAHDLNNVLAPILLAVGLLQNETQDPELLPLLETMQYSAERASALVQQVLSFARGVEGRNVLLNPKHLLRGLLNVLRQTLPKSIGVTLESHDELWTISGDPTQIHQVLLNLCVNARDAMPDGGTLAVTAENVVLDATYTTMNVEARAGAYVVIAVSDTGTGIPADVLDKIFEPFFTTKEVGKGTGLGLSTSMAIVKRHGGFIHAYTEVGHGTKFKVYLPADAALTATEIAATEKLRLPRGHGELVLVVDDEEAIRSIARTTLERFGYRVMVASNGAEAVAMYAQHRSEISVVLTDMAMPIMDGPATIIALKAINPVVKIIGCSGLPSNRAAAKAVGAGVQHFVPKPYTAEALLETLRQILTE
jgi:PAS domain S-box-containing protein